MIGRLRKAIINECGLASLIKIHQNSIFQRKKNSSYCPNEKNFLILQLFNIPRVVTCFPQACQLLPTVTAADLEMPCVWSCLSYLHKLWQLCLSAASRAWSLALQSKTSIVSWKCREKLPDDQQGFELLLKFELCHLTNHL